MRSARDWAKKVGLEILHLLWGFNNGHRAILGEDSLGVGVAHNGNGNAPQIVKARVGSSSGMHQGHISGPTEDC